MPVLTQLYRPSLALLTDLYELTMAYGYWRSGTHTKEAVFHHHFRRPPFGSGFTVACGLAPVIEFIEHFHFDEDDLSYLAGRTGIPVQYGFTGGASDGVAFLPNGIEMIPFSWPGRYSLSPVEVSDFRDVESLVKLIVSAVTD